MKVIGLLGGMSWESTIPYYRLINEAVRSKLGGLHSAELVLYSLDFDRIAQLQRDNNWTEATAVLSKAAQSLQSAGAECLVICTNTMHNIADEIQAAVDIPLVHIADAVAEAIKAQQLTTLGLLGTRFTMEQDFYRARLANKYGINVIIPNPAQRDEVHRVIYEELCQGKIVDASRNNYREIIADLVAQGAQGIILGCTEIAMLVGNDDAHVPIFDSASLHAGYVARFAMTH